MSVTYMKTLNMNEENPEWTTTPLVGYGYYSEKQAKKTGVVNYYLDTNNNKVLVTEVKRRTTNKPNFEDSIYVGALKSWISRVHCPGMLEYKRTI